jgi:hypothetical protein
VLITIEDLRRWFDEDSRTLVSKLQEETGRYGGEEAKAWARSLPGSVTGWTPQTADTISLVCYCAGLILALIAFMQSRRGQSLDGLTKFLARGPLALITIGVLIIFLRAMTGW